LERRVYYSDFCHGSSCDSSSLQNPPYLCQFCMWMSEISLSIAVGGIGMDFRDQIRSFPSFAWIICDSEAINFQVMKFSGSELWNGVPKLFFLSIAAEGILIDLCEQIPPFVSFPFNFWGSGSYEMDFLVIWNLWNLVMKWTPLSIRPITSLRKHKRQSPLSREKKP